MDRESGPKPSPTGDAVPVRPSSDQPAPTRPIISGLAADPRVPVWIRRAVIALVIGILITIFGNWRWGLTAAAAAAIIDTIYQSKQMAVIPAAARVTSAQRKTRHRLFLLRPNGYLSVNARAIPGTDSVIDHLVIGPGGVFAVDSERWDRRLPIRTGAVTAKAGPVLYHGPFSQKDRLGARPLGGRAGIPAAQRRHRPRDQRVPGDGDLRSEDPVDGRQPARRRRLLRPGDRQVLPRPDQGRSQRAHHHETDLGGSHRDFQLGAADPPPRLAARASSLTFVADLKTWVAGARPRTLPAAIVPVVVGTGVAIGYHRFSAWRAVLALVVALALQIGVNYANDYSDGIRGTDEVRVGPVRLVAGRLATPRHVLIAALASFAVAGAAGLVLAAVTSWWLLLVGLAAVAAAWFYTGGSRPYGYRALGEVSVFVFFGLVAVVGTAYVQMRYFTWLQVAAAVAGRAARLRTAGDQQPARHPHRQPDGQEDARGRPRGPADPGAVRRLRCAAVLRRDRAGPHRPR